MTFNTAEQEVIGLCVCIEAVSDIANHGLLKLRPVSAYPGETEVLFHERVHRDLFLIRLLDFVKERGNKQLTGVTGSCLKILKESCETKCFNENNSVNDLKAAVQALEDWLNYKKHITLWLPTLNINANIEISRLDFLNITGNHSKHNLSRLTAVSKDIANILRNHGYSVSEEEIPLALDDFREHLAENYFFYYSTWLAELMNNVRWGLQIYLTPTFVNSYKPPSDDLLTYSYDYPNDIQGTIPRQWFWRLMNNIRAKPPIKKFSGAHYLKLESSLEWEE